MAQSYTSDCFAGGHVAQTDLQNMENNFAALKSNFSGGSAPSNPVPGMLWHDGSTAILKARTSGASWQNVFDVNSGYALKLGRTVTAGTGLSGGGTLTTDLTISHAAHTGEVTGTTALTIAENVVSGENLNQNAVTYISYPEEIHSSGGSGWNNKLQYCFRTPSDKGFLRLLANVWRYDSCVANLRLKAGNAYSSGSGTITNSSASTGCYWDCGAVSLSTLASGEDIWLAIQLYKDSDPGIASAAAMSVVWGSST